MGVIVLLSAKSSPGVTTTAAALTVMWPMPVVLADCDPSGGDLAVGWLSWWAASGHLRRDRGVLGFATDTRHENRVEAFSLEPHLQQVPVAPRARLLTGLAHPGQDRSVGADGWDRLADALTCLPHDVLVDAGRLGPATPWPLLLAADAVLLTVRATPRSLFAAHWAMTELTRYVEPHRLCLTVCASSPGAAREAERALGRPVAMDLPPDPRAAEVLANGANAGRLPARSSLTRAAEEAAERLYRRLRLRPAPDPARLATGTAS